MVTGSLMSARVRSRSWSAAAVLALSAGAALAGALACSKDEPEPTFLRPEDLSADGGFGAMVFDPNNIVDTASFTDTIGVDVTMLQRFFQRTPYGMPSFLETFQSNGVRASESLVRAASVYRLNPLVLLVYLQALTGLVAERYYPIDAPNRVEYAFACGCSRAGECEPRLAGLDVQIECVAHRLRAALDDVAATGQTASGFGPGRTSTTLDGLPVTPANEATAAIYDLTPTLGEGASGAWLFWSVWQVYAAHISYFGSSGGSGGSAWVGDACQKNTQCGYEAAVCARNYVGGLCTAPCTGECPAAQGKALTFCADFREEGGYCFPVCNPAAPNCRSGYICTSVRRFGGEAADSQSVCYPASPE